MEAYSDILSTLIKKTYVSQGNLNGNSRHNMIRNLLIHRRLPSAGWDDTTIEYLTNEFSIMDSNNFYSNAGVGEREGRVFSTIVSRRHFGLAHGIGRSGDIAEVQPKAAGSSIIYILATYLMRHALQISGLSPAVSENCLIVPMATGLTLTMSMLTLKARATNPNCKYVIWPRIDQKSCFKSVLTAGLIPLIVENVMENDTMHTNIEAIRALIGQYGDEILCVLSTTSCFAPRQPDMVDEIAKLCKEANIGHVINNAYGLQCEYISKLINRACVIGRVDAIVQSTDKNFMVPVGGAIVVSPSSDFIANFSGNYPGRASMTPILDVFVTLLSMGETGYKRLLTTRKKLIAVMKEKMVALSERFGIPLLESPRNSISLAFCLDEMCLVEEQEENITASVAVTAPAVTLEKRATVPSTSPSAPAGSPAAITYLGSMLFQRGISGLRVVAYSSKISTIAGKYQFPQWGSHSAVNAHHYFTVAVSIGLTEEEVDHFIDVLTKSIVKFKNQRVKTNKKTKSASGAGGVTCASEESNTLISSYTGSGTVEAAASSALNTV